MELQEEVRERRDRVEASTYHLAGAYLLSPTVSMEAEDVSTSECGSDS